MDARASDWIPVSVSLATREEVLLLASRLKRSRAEVIGWLIITWSWFSVETTDGRTRLDVAMLASSLGVPERFLKELASVGWLRIGEDGCEVVDWDKWLSMSSKRRVVERTRKARWRSASRIVVKQSPDKNDRDSDSSGESRENGTEAGAVADERPVAQSQPCSVRERVLPLRSKDGSAFPVGLRNSGGASLAEAKRKIEAAWNAITGLPKIRKWTDKRLGALRARIRDPCWLEDALRALRVIAEGKCPFLFGDNDGGWVANIEWFLRPDSVTKVLEGNYGGRKYTGRRVGAGQLHPKDRNRW